jgi:organic hydroperoxide reductase OsmC/OhrA
MCVEVSPRLSRYDARMKGEHHYKQRLIWDGNRGEGTSTYFAYGRNYRLLVEGKPEIQGTADTAFRGEAEKWNPEDLFVAAISSCHMLSYLALCAREKISVLSYEDEATGVMKEDGKGGGRFEQVTLHPVVTIANADHLDRARELHERAHQLCFIASSVSIPIHHEAEVRA